MSTQTILLDNFSKGIRANTLLVGKGESADLTNLNHIAGGLATTPQAAAQAPYDSAGASSGYENIYSIDPYVDAAGLGCYIARRGLCVWLGRPMVDISGQPYRWYPLMVPTYDAETLRWGARANACRERVEQIGYRAYFSPENPGASDYLMVWDGLVVDKIETACSGSLVGGYNEYTISNDSAFGTDGMANFAAADVAPGDILIFQVGGVWQLVGHVIVAVSASAVYTNATDSTPDVALTASPAVIVRVRRAGIPAAGTAFATDDTTISSVSVLPAGVYQYVFQYAYSYGAEPVFQGDPSIASAMVVETAEYTVGGTGNLSVTHGVSSLTVAAPGIQGGAALGAFYTTSGPGTLSTSIDVGIGFTITSSVDTDTSAVDWRVFLHPEIRVSGWSANPPPGVDTLLIYRSQMGAAGAMNPYYLLETISLIGSETIAGTSVQQREVPDYYYDTGQTVDLNTPLLQVDLDQPGPLAALTEYDSRLYASQQAAPNVMQLSTLGAYESWPLLETDEIGTTPANANTGGAVQLGSSAAEPIVAMVPEVGTWATTGLVGSDLLVGFPTRCIRWNGNTAADFQVSEGIAVGMMNPALAINAGEQIFFFDGDHFRLLAIGGSTADVVSYQLWPRGLKDYLGSLVDAASVVANWSACYKEGWVYVACGLTANGNDRVYALHLPSRTWTKFGAGLADLTVANLTGTLNNPKVVGVSSQADDNGLYELVDLLGQYPASMAISYISSPIMPSKSPEHLRNLKHISSVTACMDSPEVDQSVEFALYVNGDTQNPLASDTETLLRQPASWQGSPFPGKQIVEWKPPAYDAIILQVGLSATLSEPTAINWIAVTIETR